jgi:hypothetical protein
LCSIAQTEILSNKKCSNIPLFTSFESWFHLVFIEGCTTTLLPRVLRWIKKLVSLICQSTPSGGKVRPCLDGWNVCDSGSNQLEPYQRAKIWNVSVVNQCKTFQDFGLREWNDKIVVLSDYDSHPSYFNWIWTISTNEANDFIKWFWFNRESFLKRNWNISVSQWIWNHTKHTKIHNMWCTWSLRLLDGWLTWWHVPPSTAQKIRTVFILKTLGR